MQVSTLSILKKTSLAKYVVAFLKLGLLLGMLYFIGMHLWQQQDSSGRMLLQLQQGWHNLANGWALLALLLVPFNWLPEAIKWQLLSGRLQQVSLPKSMAAVLAGVCLGLLTPRSLGEYAGRMLVQGTQHQVKLAGAVLLNRLVQSNLTFVAGIAGILCMVWQLGLSENAVMLWLLFPSFICCLLLLAMLGTWRGQLISRLKNVVGDKAARWVTVIGEYTARELLLLHAWSGLRYGVFSLQFLLLLWWAGIGGSTAMLLAAITVTFLLKSLLPAFNLLSDLGVREFSALLVFSLIAAPEPEVIAASLLLWLMNICLPALFGVVVVLGARYKAQTC